MVFDVYEGEGGMVKGARGLLRMICVSYGQCIDETRSSSALSCVEVLIRGDLENGLTLVRIWGEG